MYRSKDWTKNKACLVVKGISTNQDSHKANIVSKITRSQINSCPNRSSYKCITKVSSLPTQKTPTDSKQAHFPFSSSATLSPNPLQHTTSMAFTALSFIRSWPSMVVSDNMKDGFSLRNKAIYKRQRSLRDLTVANVASPLPVIAPPPPPEERPATTGGHHHHVAWTSIPQERWEGELVVQGQIPLWLVSANIKW